MALRREFPSDGFHITLVLSAAAASIIQRLDCADEIIKEEPLHPRHPIFWIFTRSGFIAKSLRWAIANKAEVVIICHRYRSLGCDFAVSLCNPAIAVAYGANEKYLMYPMAHRLQRDVYDKMYAYLLAQQESSHQMDDLDRLLSWAVGHAVTTGLPGIKSVYKMLDFFDLGVLPSEYIVLVPGAHVMYRRWPIKKFIEVARSVGSPVVVVGTSDESELGEEVARSLNVKVYNMCGKTTLSQLGGIMYRAKIVITNETGTATYASMIGAKTVCVLGGGDFGAFHPNKRCRTTLCAYRMRECFGCDWKCKEANLSGSAIAPCVDAISVSDVYEAVRKFLETNNNKSNNKSANTDKRQMKYLI
jgi:hypothetical protein